MHMKIMRGESTVGLLFSDTVLAAAFFPLWWYTQGLRFVASGAISLVSRVSRTMGFVYWVINIFRPMYGVRDFTGRVVSFFMRLVMIIWYGFWLLILSLLMFLAVAVYLVLPPLVAVMIYLQAVGLLAS